MNRIVDLRLFCLLPILQYVQQSDANFTHILLFGVISFDKNRNSLILMVLMDYLVATGRFDQPLFNNY